MLIKMPSNVIKNEMENIINNYIIQEPVKAVHVEEWIKRNHDKVCRNQLV